MTINYLFPLDLSLFGEGGGAAGAAAGGDGATGAQGETTAAPAATRRGKAGENTVLYGKQAQPAAAETSAPDAGESKQGDVIVTSDALEAKRKAFRDMVQGEYKDIYTEETQRIINSRFKQTKGLEDALAAQQPVIDMLAQRYKLDGKDMGKLVEAVENDNAYWEEAADEAGMTVEQYKKFQKLERENRQLLNAERQRAGEAAAQNQLQQWYTQAEEARKKFPRLNIEEEAKNPQFINMLRAGVPVEHAYKTLHFDEIMSDAMTTSAAVTERRVVDNVRAKGARPRENGTAAQNGFTIKDDVSKLTRKDRAEIARRVARGDLISF